MAGEERAEKVFPFTTGPCPSICEMKKRKKGIDMTTISG
jgi:hypothetical protein